MPSKSKKQRRFMAAAANNPKFAKKVGIKQSVAREFHEADKRRGYAKGGRIQRPSRSALRLIENTYRPYLSSLNEREGNIVENVSGGGVDEITSRELATLRRLIRAAPRLPEDTRTYRADNSFPFPRRAQGGYPIPTTLDPLRLPGVAWNDNPTISVIDLHRGDPSLYLDVPNTPMKSGWPLNVFEEQELLLPPGGNPRGFKPSATEVKKLLELLEVPMRKKNQVNFYEYDPPYKAQGGRVEYASGGLARTSTTGFRTPMESGPRASRGSTGTLGSPASLGGLGGARIASGGFGTRPGAARPTAVGALGVSGPRGSSNLRPKPGRGVNPLLATAGIPYHTAETALARLRGKVI